jgi:hypothetical protein
MAVDKTKNMVSGGERGYPHGDNYGNEKYEALRYLYFERFQRLQLQHGGVWQLNKEEGYYLRLFHSWKV